MSIVRQWDNRLDQRNVKLVEYRAAAGEYYWRLIRGEYRDEAQSRGKHHIFVDVLSTEGRRITGQNVRFFWSSGEQGKPTETKPGEEAAVDFPLFSAGYGYSCEAVGGNSDTVTGMGLGSIESPHMGIHVSYYLVFQLTRAGDVTVPEPPEPPTPPVPPTPPDARNLIEAEIFAAIRSILDRYMG